MLRLTPRARRIETVLGREFSAGGVDKHGFANLHYAALVDDFDLACALLDAGADLGIKCAVGCDGWKYFGLPPPGCRAGRCRCAAWLGMDCTPLHFAAHGGALRVANLLLARSADVDALEGLAETPLWLAARSNATGVMGALLDYGAVLEGRSYGDLQTALHGAASYAAAEAVALLLARGAGVHARNQEGETALNMAARSDAPGVVAALLAHGADPNARSSWRGAAQSPRVDALAVGGTPLDVAAGENARAAATPLLEAGAKSPIPALHLRAWLTTGEAVEGGLRPDARRSALGTSTAGRRCTGR